MRILVLLFLGLLTAFTPTDGFASRTRLHITYKGAPASGGAFATLAPGAGFNGTPCSGYAGGTCLTAITRTTAQPAIHWIVPSERRLVSDQTLCVDADAKGGIDHVRFYGEGGTTDVTTPQVITDTNANGATRKRWGYCVTLDAAAWRAKTTTGTGRLFAEAFPVDGTMQSRRIGLDDIDRGDYTMVTVPRAAEYEWPGDADGTKTVCPSGCDYTTIKLAMDAARAAAAPAPRIVINTTGNYEIEDTTQGNGDTFLELTAAPGVTATIRSAAAYRGAPTDPFAWSWEAGWNKIHFKGSGIVLDIKNWTNVDNAGPDWFDGIRVVNSAGPQAIYFNGGAHPGFGGGAIPSYWDDVYFEYGIAANPFTFQRYVIGAQLKGVWGDLFSQTHYVANTYVRGADSTFLRDLNPGMTIHFSCSGCGHTTASVSKDFGDGQAGGNITLKVDGVVTHTIPASYFSTGTNPTVNDIVAAINSFSAEGWSASVATPTKGLTRPGGIGCQSPFTNQNAFNTDFTPTVCFDVHGDWFQNGGFGNVILRNNFAWEIVDYSSFFNFDAADTEDVAILNNAFLGGSGAGSGFVSDSRFGVTRRHFLVRGNTFQMRVFRVKATAGDQTYSEFKNNIVLDNAYTDTGSGSTCSNDTPWVNNLYGTPSSCDANAAPGESGNVTYTSSGFSALFAGVASGNVREAASGTISVNLKAKVDDYDQRFCLRSANDNIGAWSKNCAATALPF